MLMNLLKSSNTVRSYGKQGRIVADTLLLYYKTSGFCTRVRARACAARTRLSERNATPNGALRAPHPSQLRCFIFIGQKIYYFQKLKLPSGRPQAARVEYLSTGPPRL
jgi:hypothetical protein